MRNIIKYLGIALVIVGILLVMKNLFSNDTNWSNNNENKTKNYKVKIKLLDNETKNYLSGSKLVLKDEYNNLVAEWTTEEKAYTIDNLKKGEYTLSQETAPENYHLNKENITFEIKNADKNVVMYNTKMTEEEIKEANTKESEVGVDNTSSSKSILTIITAIITTTLGLNLIYKAKKD